MTMKVFRSVAMFALAAVLAAPAGANAQGRGRGAAKQAERQQQSENRREGKEMRFRGMDVDNDGVITRDEWRGNDESFRQQDTNRDGVLSGDEVWVPAAQGTPDRSRREERAARFERADTNGDGRISVREWTGTRAMFDRMDRNRDEFLSRDEFMEVVTNRPAPTTGERAVPRDSQSQTRAYQAGYQKGLEEGRQAGREDKNVNGGKWDLEGQRELEQADSGYRNELGTRTDYQAGYRAGFRVGYRDGFGPRR
jgi:Ca2+-binding EF-hand superfamily protein